MYYKTIFALSWLITKILPFFLRGFEKVSFLHVNNSTFRVVNRLQTHREDPSSVPSM